MMGDSYGLDECDESNQYNQYNQYNQHNRYQHQPIPTQPGAGYAHDQYSLGQSHVPTQSVARYVAMPGNDTPNAPEAPRPSEAELLPPQPSEAAVRRAKQHLPFAQALLQHAQLVKQVTLNKQPTSDYDPGYGLFQGDVDMHAPGRSGNRVDHVTRYEESHSQLEQILHSLQMHRNRVRCESDSSLHAMPWELAHVAASGSKSRFHALCDDVERVQHMQWHATVQEMYRQLPCAPETSSSRVTSVPVGGDADGSGIKRYGASGAPIDSITRETARLAQAEDRRSQMLDELEEFCGEFYEHSTAKVEILRTLTGSRIEHSIDPNNFTFNETKPFEQQHVLIKHVLEMLRKQAKVFEQESLPGEDMAKLLSDMGDGSKSGNDLTRYIPTRVQEEIQELKSSAVQRIENMIQVEKKIDNSLIELCMISKQQDADSKRTDNGPAPLPNYFSTSEHPFGRANVSQATPETPLHAAGWQYLQASADVPYPVEWITSREQQKLLEKQVQKRLNLMMCELLKVKDEKDLIKVMDQPKTKEYIKQDLGDASDTSKTEKSEWLMHLMGDRNPTYLQSLLKRASEQGISNHLVDLFKCSMLKKQLQFNMRGPGNRAAVEAGVREHWNDINNFYDQNIFVTWPTTLNANLVKELNEQRTKRLQKHYEKAIDDLFTHSAEKVRTAVTDLKAQFKKAKSKNPSSKDPFKEIVTAMTQTDDTRFDTYLKNALNGSVNADNLELEIQRIRGKNPPIEAYLTHNTDPTLCFLACHESRPDFLANSISICNCFRATPDELKAAVLNFKHKLQAVSAAVDASRNVQNVSIRAWNLITTGASKLFEKSMPENISKAFSETLNAELASAETSGADLQLYVWQTFVQNEMKGYTKTDLKTLLSVYWDVLLDIKKTPTTAPTEMRPLNLDDPSKASLSSNPPATLEEIALTLGYIPNVDRDLSGIADGTIAKVIHKAARECYWTLAMHAALASTGVPVNTFALNRKTVGTKEMAYAVLLDAAVQYVFGSRTLETTNPDWQYMTKLVRETASSIKKKGFPKSPNLAWTAAEYPDADEMLFYMIHLVLPVLCGMMLNHIRASRQPFDMFHLDMVIELALEMIATLGGDYSAMSDAPITSLAVVDANDRKRADKAMEILNHRGAYSIDQHIEATMRHYDICTWGESLIQKLGTRPFMSDKVRKMYDRIKFDLHAEATDFGGMMLPLFDAGGLMRGLTEQAYITELAQQVLAALLEQWPHLRHERMSIDLIYAKERNDFYNDFVQLLYAREQLTRRFNGVKVTYASDAKKVANYYRTKSFVFKHARVTELAYQNSTSTQVYLLDDRVKGVRAAATVDRSVLAHHSCEILMRGKIIESATKFTEDLRKQKNADDRRDEAFTREMKVLNQRIELAKTNISTQQSEVWQSEYNKNSAEIGNLKGEIAAIEDDKLLSTEQKQAQIQPKESEKAALEKRNEEIHEESHKKIGKTTASKKTTGDKDELKREKDIASLQLLKFRLQEQEYKKKKRDLEGGTMSQDDVKALDDLHGQRTSLMKVLSSTNKEMAKAFKDFLPDRSDPDKARTYFYASRGESTFGNLIAAEIREVDRMMSLIEKNKKSPTK